MDRYGWSYRWRLSRAAGIGMTLVAVTAGTLGASGSAAGSAAAATAAPAGAGSAWLDSEWGDDDTKESEKASAETGTWKANKDSGSLYTVSQDARGA